MSRETQNRFDAVRDPADNWLVFDMFTGCPAQIGSLMLIGLEERYARLLAKVLEGGRRRLTPSETAIGSNGF